MGIFDYTPSISFQEYEPSIRLFDEEEELPIHIKHKRRGSDYSVRLGYKISPKRFWTQPYYYNPRRRGVEEGKVVLVVAGKGIGKTNTLRNFVQAHYRTTRDDSIVVFQEKRGDLDFLRHPSPERLVEMNVEPVRLRSNGKPVQRYLVPGRNFKIPLQELEYSALMAYIGKKMGQSIADRIIERAWRDVRSRRDIRRFRIKLNEILQNYEEDPYFRTMQASVERFCELLEYDSLIETERDNTFLDYIDREIINIIDLSDIGDYEIKQFIVSQVLTMMERHFKRTRSFIGITEAHTYCPEEGMNPAKQAIIRAVTVLARSYGWTVFLETQSPHSMEKVVIENVDEVFILGYIPDSKLNKLLKTLSVNLYDLVSFYYLADDIGKGEGIYGNVLEPTRPYIIKIGLSPVG
jgi:hypothetical protein